MTWFLQEKKIEMIIEGIKERSASYVVLLSNLLFLKVHIVSKKLKSTQNITLILFVHYGLQFEFYPKFNVSFKKEKRDRLNIHKPNFG